MKVQSKVQVPQKLTKTKHDSRLEPEGVRPVGTLTSDLWDCQMTHSCCWSFVRAAVGTQHGMLLRWILTE